MENVLRLILLLATLFPIASLASIYSETTKSILKIDPRNSTLTLNPSIFISGDDTVALPITRPLGGYVQIEVTDLTIDTNQDGTPMSEALTIQRIYIELTDLMLPAIFDDFSPEATGLYELSDNTIYSYDSCRIWLLMGGSCTRIIDINLLDIASMGGGFDGNLLILNGHNVFGTGAPYYSYHVEAFAVPLPSSIVLISGVLIWLIGFRTRRTTSSDMR